MGVKQGCPLSLTLFGIYIDELAELILEYLREKSSFLNTVLILLYADDVFLMAHTFESRNQLLELLKELYERSGLTINVAHTLTYTPHTSEGKQETRKVSFDVLRRLCKSIQQSP